MAKEFVDFECSNCGIHFWTETERNKIRETVERTCNKKCPNCNKTGGVKRIPTPSEYV